MQTVHIPGYPSIVRVHCESGELGGYVPVMVVALVAEIVTPPELRDDWGFLTHTQMCMLAYSEN